MKINKNLNKYSKLGLYFILAIIIVFLVQSLPFRLDLTRSRYYTLSDASRTAVKKLEEPLVVTAFISDVMPSQYNDLERDLSGILKTFSLYGNDNFNYKIIHVNPGKGEEDDNGTTLESIASSYGISPINVQVLGETQATATSVYMGLAIEYLNQVERIPNLGAIPGRNLENNITSLIDKVSRKNNTFLSLDDKITIEIVYTPELSRYAPYINNVPTDLNELLNRLNKDNFNIFTGGVKNLSEEGNKIDPLALGLSPLQAESSEESYFYGFVVRYQEKEIVNNLVEQGFLGQVNFVELPSIEKNIINIAETLTNVNDTIGYVSSNKTTSRVPMRSNPFQQQPAGDSISNFSNLLSQTYNITDVNFADEIEENVKTLVIVDPKEEFTDWQLYQIDQHVMQGKSLLVFYNTYLEQASQQQQFGAVPPTYVPNHTGLETLLDSYGFEIDYSYVMDEKAFFYQQQGPNGGIQQFTLYFVPQLTSRQINDDLSFLKNIRQLYLPNISPISMKEGLEGVPLFYSSDKAWKVAENINLYNPQMIIPPGEREVFDLGYLYKGSLKSYFADKDIPSKPVGEEESTSETSIALADSYSLRPFKKSVEKAKVIVVPSGALLGNDLIDELGQGANATLALNMVDYLTDREDFAVMRAKGQGFALIEDVDDAKAKRIKAINIMGIPVLVLILGLGMLYAWRKRQNKIKVSFKKNNE